MGFIGAINDKARKWFGNIAPSLDDRFVVVGCSGNFTIEQLISRYAKPKHIWSNDVSLYTSILGAYLCDQDFELEILDGSISFVQKYLKTTEDKAATILILSEALKYEKCKNIYEVRLWSHYQAEFASYHKKTIEKLKNRRENIKIDRYTKKDIENLLIETPSDAVVIAYMPTYEGGYEKIYKRMEEVFSWDNPEYTIIDAESKNRIIEIIRGFDYIYIDDIRRDDMPCVAVIRRTGMKTVYQYSNLKIGKGAYIVEKKFAEETFYQRLSEDDEITPKSEITIKKTTNNIINYFRNLYLKKSIEYANGDECFLVFIDEKLFGFLIFNPSRLDSEGMYMLCDFVISVKRYPRLSKLLLLISCSDWIKEKLEEKYLREVATIFTTAFTEKPVSMKYRGVFKLYSRKEGMLNYISRTGQYKLREIAALWLKRYQQKK